MKGKIELPHYYAIIPANVRYDKKLPANCKLLYGEITALCNLKGCCWANNRYFAELYQVSKETISRWLTILSAQKYIKIKIIEAKGNKRNIWLGGIDENVKTSYQKRQDLLTKTSRPIDENVNHNNTIPILQSNNTENNNNIGSLSQTALALELDKKLKRKAVEYELKIQSILPPRTNGERTTYNRLREHLCLLIMDKSSHKYNERLFDQVIQWARDALNINGNPRALWIAKCKEQLGFKGQGKTLLEVKNGQ